MSSESKMGCRYIQLRWQPSHSEVTSCTRRSLRSQSAMRSSKGPLYGEKENCCVSTMWSSSSEFTSSVSLITPVPVLRYGITSKSQPSHAATMSLSVFSMANSFIARSVTFCTFSRVAFSCSRSPCSGLGLGSGPSRAAAAPAQGSGSGSGSG